VVGQVCEDEAFGVVLVDPTLPLAVLQLPALMRLTYLNRLTSHSNAFSAGLSSSLGPASVINASSALFSCLFSSLLIWVRSSALLCSLNRFFEKARNLGSSAQRSLYPS
jgi:hypothetical protein